MQEQIKKAYSQLGGATRMLYATNNLTDKQARSILFELERIEKELLVAAGEYEAINNRPPHNYAADIKREHSWWHRLKVR